LQEGEKITVVCFFVLYHKREQIGLFFFASIAVKKLPNFKKNSNFSEGKQYQPGNGREPMELFHSISFGAVFSDKSL